MAHATSGMQYANVCWLVYGIKAALQRAAKPLQQLGAPGRVLNVSPVRADKDEEGGLFAIAAVAGGNERLKMWWRSPVWNSEL